MALPIRTASLVRVAVMAAFLVGSLASPSLSSEAVTDRQISDNTAEAACSVPGTHATIQEAVDDLACDSVDLTESAYFESVRVSRSLTLTGGPSDLHGQLTVSDGATAVEIDGLTIAGPTIFMDGFEAGDTSAWSNSVP